MLNVTVNVYTFYATTYYYTTIRCIDVGICQLQLQPHPFPTGLTNILEIFTGNRDADYMRDVEN